MGAGVLETLAFAKLPSLSSEVYPQAEQSIPMGILRSVTVRAFESFRIRGQRHELGPRYVISCLSGVTPYDAD